jgi:hypothetical protein
MKKSRNELLEFGGGILVVLGLLVEIALAANTKDAWSLVVANSLIAIGVIMEIRFGGNARAESEERAAEANERAANADLARIELEKQLAARTITKEQFEILKKLKGKISAVIVASEVDVEPSWFASVLATALGEVGLEVRIASRKAGAHGTGNMIYDKLAFSNPNGEPTNGEPLFSILNEAGIPIISVLARCPMDLFNETPDVPIIIIGGRFLVPPSPPYFGADIPSSEAKVK